jgi:hypothetical protein
VLGACIAIVDAPAGFGLHTRHTVVRACDKLSLGFGLAFDSVVICSFDIKWLI